MGPRPVADCPTCNHAIIDLSTAWLLNGFDYCSQECARKADGKVATEAGPFCSGGGHG